MRSLLDRAPPPQSALRHVRSGCSHSKGRDPYNLRGGGVRAEFPHTPDWWRPNTATPDTNSTAPRVFVCVCSRARARARALAQLLCPPQKQCPLIPILSFISQPLVPTGDGFNQVRVGQLCTQIGTLNMAVAYRTKITFSPTQTGRDNTIMLKSDHFLKDISPKHARYNYNKKLEKKVIDLDKPMRCGAFVDASRVKKHIDDVLILPETPPFSWLLPKPRDESAYCGEDRVSLHSPTNVDENCSSNANNLNNNNNNSKGSYESNSGATAAGPMHFRLSQSPKSNAADGIGGATALTGATVAIPPTNTTTGGASPPCSLGAGGELRRSSRWSIRRDPSENDPMMKELPFAFAETTAQGELAKFLRECSIAPTLHEFDMKRSSGADTITEEEHMDGSRILTEADTCPDSGDEDDTADVTRQLEQFETCLPEYEYLLSSLCQSIDSNSNS
uniref:Autophagy-related protein 13 n=1 Tax=Anopheles farauti TaxID=69004 RepID=A0A182QBY5_9DIPT